MSAFAHGAGSKSKGLSRYEPPLGPSKSSDWSPMICFGTLDFDIHSRPSDYVWFLLCMSTWKNIMSKCSLSLRMSVSCCSRKKARKWWDDFARARISIFGMHHDRVFGSIKKVRCEIDDCSQPSGIKHCTRFYSSLQAIHPVDKVSKGRTAPQWFDYQRPSPKRYETRILLP